MVLTIPLLLEILRDFDVREYMVSKLPEKIFGVRLLHPEIKVLDPRYIYIGIDSDLNHMTAIPDNAAIICYGGISPHSFLKQKNFNLYIIQKTLDFGEFYNYIMNITDGYFLWADELRLLALKKAPLNRFIQISENYFPGALSIVDLSAKTLAVSKEFCTDDPLFDYIQAGFIPKRILSDDALDFQNLRKLTSNHKTVQVYSEFSNRIVMVQPIFVSYRLLGYVFLHGKTEQTEFFSEGIQELFSVFTGAVSSRLENDELYNTAQGLAYEFLFFELIEQNIPSHAVLQERADGINWNLSARKQILKITFAEKNITSEQLNLLRKELENIFVQQKCIVYRKSLVVMNEQSSSKETLLHENHLFPNWLKGCNAHCGVSNLYTDTMKTHESFMQASLALKFGQLQTPSEQIHHYCDYIFMHTVEILDHNIDIHSLLHPAITKLMQLQENQPYLMDTLKAYLRCERNINESAKALFIHRNSMVYRIKRLEEELSEYDLSKYNTRAQLLFSLDILNYIECHKKTDVSL